MAGTNPPLLIQNLKITSWRRTIGGLQGSFLLEAKIGKTNLSSTLDRSVRVSLKKAEAFPEKTEKETPSKSTSNQRIVRLACRASGLHSY